jgi:putative DNA primase/helicase
MPGARHITKVLEGRWHGSYGTAPCPAHDDRNPSLSLATGTDGKVLLRCHAGCYQAQVIEALRARGLWEKHGWQSGRSQIAKTGYPKTAPSERDDEDKTEYARRIWRAVGPASNTLAESYLRSRGLHLPLSSTLRFHGGLKHPSVGIWPAMVALVSRGPDDASLAVHRMFLSRDGSGKAPVNPEKMMLARCSGGAVHLAPVGGTLIVGEGIETTLSVQQATGLPGWAALSTSGLVALRLPGLPLAQTVVIAADHDDPGLEAAEKAAARWQAEGRVVRIAKPPVVGWDFNDMAMAPESVAFWPERRHG